MTYEEAEKLDNLIRAELKNDGFSAKDINEIMLMVTGLLMEFILARAPLTDSRFLAGLEVLLRVLKVLKDQNVDTNRKDIH